MWYDSRVLDRLKQAGWGFAKTGGFVVGEDRLVCDLRGQAGLWFEWTGQSTRQRTYAAPMENSTAAGLLCLYLNRQEHTLSHTHKHTLTPAWLARIAFPSCH